MAEMIRDPRVMKKAQVEIREIFNVKGEVDEICINELRYLKSVVKYNLANITLNNFSFPLT